MRLTYFVQYFPPEQASGLHLVEDLLDGFIKHGWDVNLYTPSPTRGVTDSQRKEYANKRIEKRYNGKLTIHRMRLYREGRGFFSRALRYVLFSFECFWKAVTVPADFIFTGSGPPTQGIVVSIAKKLSREKKVIFNLQDIFPDSLVASGICDKESKLMIIGRVMENFTYKNVDVIITITEDMQANVISKGVDPEKVKVVRNWVDVNRVKPITEDNNRIYEEFKLEHGKFYVVYAGNLGKVQGVEVILEAARLLEKQERIHFVIFGNGSEEKYIKRQAEYLTNVSLFPLQPMDRVSEVYSLGSVSIIPCKSGTGGYGMPSKTWTIMAAGTAIIASFDLGGEMEKVIKDAKCGFCINAGDAEMLAMRIMELYMNPQEVVMMGLNARKYVIEHASSKLAVQKYIEIIEDTIKNK